MTPAGWLALIFGTLAALVFFARRSLEKSGRDRDLAERIKITAERIKAQETERKAALEASRFDEQQRKEARESASDRSLTDFLRDRSRR